MEINYIKCKSKKMKTIRHQVILKGYKLAFIFAFYHTRHISKIIYTLDTLTLLILKALKR